LVKIILAFWHLLSSCSAGWPV